MEEWIVEPLIANGIGDSAGMDTSFLDSIPNRLTIESRRWDPFYFTDHQIVAATDGMAFRDTGLGFSGQAKLDKWHVLLRISWHVLANGMAMARSSGCLSRERPYQQRQ